MSEKKKGEKAKDDELSLERGLEAGSSGDSCASEYAVAYAFRSHDADFACFHVFERLGCYVSANEHDARWKLAAGVNRAVCASAGFEQVHRQRLPNQAFDHLCSRRRQVL